MKRIQYACLEQTLRFSLKEEVEKSEAERQIKAEIEIYKARLEKSRTRYKILEQTAQPDGSVLLKIKKQYNGHDVGAYFD